MPWHARRKAAQMQRWWWLCAAGKAPRRCCSNTSSSATVAAIASGRATTAGPLPAPQPWLNSKRASRHLKSMSSLRPSKHPWQRQQQQQQQHRQQQHHRLCSSLPGWHASSFAQLHQQQQGAPARAMSSSAASAPSSPPSPEVAVNAYRHGSGVSGPALSSQQRLTHAEPEATPSPSSTATASSSNSSSGGAAPSASSSIADTAEKDRLEQVSNQVRMIAEMETKGLRTDHTRTTFLQQHAAAGEPDFFTRYVSVESLMQDDAWRQLLMQAYARASQHTAVTSLQHMRQTGFAVDRQLTHECIEAFTEAGRAREASELLLRLLDYEKKPWTGARRLYTQVISRLCKEGEPMRAIDVVNAFMQYNVLINNHTFRLIMDALASRGQYEEASAFFNAMLAAGLVPHRGVYRAFLDAYLAAGQVREAARLVDIMAHSKAIDDWEHARVEMYNRVFRGLLANDSVKAAKAYATAAPDFRFFMDQHTCSEVVRLYEAGALPATTVTGLFQALGALKPYTLASLCDLAQAISSRAVTSRSSSTTTTGAVAAETAAPSRTTAASKAGGDELAPLARPAEAAIAGDVSHLDTLLTLIQQVRRAAKATASADAASEPDLLGDFTTQSLQRAIEAAGGLDRAMTGTASTAGTVGVPQKPSATAAIAATDTTTAAVGTSTSSRGGSSRAMDSNVASALLAAMRLKVALGQWAGATSLLKDAYALRVELTETQRALVTGVLSSARHQWADSQHQPTTTLAADAANTQAAAASTAAATEAFGSTGTGAGTASADGQDLAELRSFLSTYESLSNPQFAMAAKEAELATAVGQQGSVEAAFSVISGMKEVGLSVSHRHYARIAALTENDPAVLLFHFEKMGKEGYALANTEVDWLVRHLVSKGRLSTALDVPKALRSYKPSRTVLREVLSSAAAATTTTTTTSAITTGRDTAAMTPVADTTAAPAPTPAVTADTGGGGGDGDLLERAVQLYMGSGASFSQAEVEALVEETDPVRLPAVVHAVRKAHDMRPDLVDGQAFVALAERLAEAGLTQDALSLVRMCQRSGIKVPERVYAWLGHQTLAQLGWDRFAQLRDEMTREGVTFSAASRQQLRKRAEALWKEDEKRGAAELITASSKAHALVQAAASQSLRPHVFCTEAVAEEVCHALVRRRDAKALAAFIARVHQQLLPVSTNTMSSLLRLAYEAKDVELCMWDVSFCHQHGLRIPASGVRFVLESLVAADRRGEAIDYLFSSMDTLPLLCRPATLAPLLCTPSQGLRGGKRATGRGREDGTALLWEVSQRALSLNSGKVLNGLMDYLLQEARHEDAATLFTDIVLQKRHLVHKREYFRKVTTGLVQHGRLQAALRFLADMAQHGFRADQDTNMSLLSFYSGKGDLSKAQELLDAIVDGGYRAKDAMFTTIVLGALAHGDVARAETLFARMLSDDRTDIVPAMLGLARHYAHQGAWEAVNKLSQTYLLLGKVKTRHDAEAELQRLFDRASAALQGARGKGTQGRSTPQQREKQKTTVTDPHKTEKKGKPHNIDAVDMAEDVGHVGSGTSLSDAGDVALLGKGEGSIDLQRFLVAGLGAPARGTTASEQRQQQQQRRAVEVKTAQSTGTSPLDAHNNDADAIRSDRRYAGAAGAAALDEQHELVGDSSQEQDVVDLSSLRGLAFLKDAGLLTPQQKRWAAALSRGQAITITTEAAASEAVGLLEHLAHAGQVQHCLSLRNAILHPASGARTKSPQPQPAAPSAISEEEAQAISSLGLTTAADTPTAPAVVEPLLCLAFAVADQPLAARDYAQRFMDEDRALALECMRATIGGCLEVANTWAAYETLRAMVEANTPLQAADFAGVLEVSFETDNRRNADRVVNLMEESGVAPSLRVYRLRLDDLVANGRMQEMQALLSEVQATRRFPASAFSKYSRLLGSRAARSSAFSSPRSSSDGSASGVSARVSDRARLAAAVGNAGPVASALFYWRPLPPKFGRQAAIRAGRLFATFGEVELTERLIEAMEERGMETGPAVWNSLLRAAMRRGGDDASSVLISAQAMHQAGQAFDAGSYAAILATLTQSQGTAAAALDKLCSFLRDLGQPTSVATFNTIMDSCVQLGRPELAQMTMDAMLARGVRPNVRSCELLMRTHERHGDLHGAERVLHSMKEWGLRPPVPLFRRLLQVYAFGGRPDDITRVVDLMQAEGIDLNEDSINALVAAYCSSGQAAQARAVMKNLEDAGYSVSHVAYISLMKGFARQHEHREALQAFEQVVNSGQSSTYSYHLALVLAQVQRDTGLEERVQSLMGNAGMTVDERLLNVLRKQLQHVSER